jgi:hypothetical protein
MRISQGTLPSPPAPPEAVSFLPFQLSRPFNPKPVKQHRFVPGLLRQNLEIHPLCYLVFTLSEARFIEKNHISVQPTADSVKKLIADFPKSPDRQIDILTALNFLVLSVGIEKALTIFTSVGLPELLPTWFVSDPDSTRRKPLLLNLLALTAQLLNNDTTFLHPLFVKVCESFIGTKGFLAKKHILVLVLILAKLADLDTIPETQLTCTYPETPSLGGSYDKDELPLNLQFVVGGVLPSAYVRAEEILRSCAQDSDYLAYAATSQFKSDSKFPPGRAFLVAIAPIIHKFIASITSNCQICSRALYAQGEYDLGYPQVDEATAKLDVQTDRDVVVFGSWGIVFLISELLGKSNVMDREIFKYLIIHTSGMNLPSVALQSFVANLKPALDGPGPSCYLVDPAVNRRRNVLAAALGIGLHVATDIISHSLETLQQLVSDKTIRNLLTVSELSESKLIMREAAYALSHFLRFIPRSNQVPRLVPFVFERLEQFELFEMWAPVTKPNLPGDPTLLQRLKTHCTHCGFKGLLPE